VIALDDDTTLLAPGGAWLPREEALVVADVHAGYVADLQRRGFALPDGHDDDLLMRLDALLHAADPARVVIAGDLVHGPGAAHTRSAAPSPLDRVLDRLRGRAVTVVLGNHDAPVAELLRARDVDCVTHCAVGPHAVVHGDEDTATLTARCDTARAAGGRVLLGHVHPALGLRGALGHRARVPAFVAGTRPARAARPRAPRPRRRPVQSRVRRAPHGPLPRGGVAGAGGGGRGGGARGLARVAVAPRGRAAPTATPRRPLPEGETVAGRGHPSRALTNQLAAAGTTLTHFLPRSLR
jgi:metallophosphoesterase superfamily enzyme